MTTHRYRKIAPHGAQHLSSLSASSIHVNLPSSKFSDDLRLSSCIFLSVDQKATESQASSLLDGDWLSMSYMQTAARHSNSIIDGGLPISHTCQPLSEIWTLANLAIAAVRHISRLASDGALTHVRQGLQNVNRFKCDSALTILWTSRCKQQIWRRRNKPAVNNHTQLVVKIFLRHCSCTQSAWVWKECPSFLGLLPKIFNYICIMYRRLLIATV